MNKTLQNMLILFIVHVPEFWRWKYSQKIQFYAALTEDDDFTFLFAYLIPLDLHFQCYHCFVYLPVSSQLNHVTYFDRYYLDFSEKIL